MPDLPLLLIFSGSFIIALSGALSPGPLLTLTVAYSYKRGFWQGPLIILGHGFIEVLLIILLLSGISILFTHRWVVHIIFLFGGALMLYMAAELFSKRKHLLSNEIEIKGVCSHPVLSGILGSLANPYWLLWWVSVGTGLLIQAKNYGVKGIIIFFTGHVAADLAWYSLVSFSFSRGKAVLSRKFSSILIYICCIFLSVLGIWFLMKPLLSLVAV